MFFVHSSYAIDTENIRRTYGETTARARPGQEENMESGWAEKENPKRGNKERHVRISD